MVTQDAAVVPNVNKMKMKMKKKKSKKKKMKGLENLDNESDGDKLDMEEKVYPLSHYITDQEELVNQMFMTISGSKLEAMLPPVLKSIPLKELKLFCLHELRGMSKKRILCCINGQVMEGSSGSEDEEEEKEQPSEDPKHNDNSKGEKRKPGDDKPSDSYLHKKIKVEPGLEDGTGSSEGKSVLELLELEMRARIIKTMLEKGDEGKKITEDTIAAVMQSASQVTNDGTDGDKEAASTAAKPKDDSKDTKSGRELEDDVEERSRGRRRGPGRGADHRRRHDTARDGKDSSSRSRRRGEGSYSESGSRARNSRRRKESSVSEKHVAKKKKITRKEFEERMKRAKKNRTYRQRKSSEDEEKANENDNQTENTKEDKDENTEDKPDAEKPDTLPEGVSTQDKTEVEVSEKEEGEIDSNEEEEGACSPSDVTSSSRYSSSRSSSRSWSRSYSRSASRSPYRGRQKKGRRSRSMSRSRSRSRRKKRRSYSRSCSRSRTPDRRHGRNDHQQRNLERKTTKESPVKKDAKKISPENVSPSREEDWGHKCDIEFVDSEEDFDDSSEGTKKDTGTQKTLPANRTERASISFSLQKKPVGITQNVDLDDLPLKKKQMGSLKDDMEPVETPKSVPKSIEIVISSDSEGESLGPSQESLMESKSDGNMSKQSKQPLLGTSASNSKEDETEKIDQSTTQPDQKEKSVEKADGSKTKDKDSSQAVMKERTETITEDTNTQQQQQQQCSDGTTVAQIISSENTECEVKKQAVDSIDKSDLTVSVPKEGFSVGSVCVDSGGSSDEAESSPVEPSEDQREHDIPSNNKEIEKSGGILNPESEGNVDTEPTSDLKDTGSDYMSKMKIQGVKDTKTDDPQISPVGKDDNNDDDDGNASRRRIRKRQPHTDTEQNSDTDTEVIVNVKNNSAIRPMEEIRDSEGPVCNQTIETTPLIEKGTDMQGEGAPASCEREDKGKMEDSEVKSAEPDGESVGCAFEDKNEGEFEKEAEQRNSSGDGDTGDTEETYKDKTTVDPSRIETRLTRSRVKSSQKFEMIMPERSWLKNKRKKKEVTKLGKEEKVRPLKSALCEGVPSSSKESELDTEISQSTKAIAAIENEDTAVLSSPSTRDTENSQPLQEIEEKQVSLSIEPDQPSEIPPAEEDKTMRKIDHDTEIIGVIETSKDTGDNFDDMGLGGSSWSMRWLQSEKVQKVVTSSKMLSRVRKKIQKKDKATKVVMAEKVEEAQKQQPEPVISVIGSIEEYERLFGTKVKKDEAPLDSASQENVGEGQTSGGSSLLEQDNLADSKNKNQAVFGSDDDGEDSEEEALWSKIIKK